MKEGSLLFNNVFNTFMVIQRLTYSNGPLTENICCLHHYKGYFFQLAAMVLLYSPSHRQDSTYHSLYYTSCGALAGTRNSSVGPPWGGWSDDQLYLKQMFYHRATCARNFNIREMQLKQNIVHHFAYNIVCIKLYRESQCVLLLW